MILLFFLTGLFHRTCPSSTTLVGRHLFPVGGFGGAKFNTFSPFYEGTCSHKDYLYIVCGYQGLMTVPSYMSRWGAPVPFGGEPPPLAGGQYEKISKPNIRQKGQKFSSGASRPDEVGGSHRPPPSPYHPPPGRLAPPPGRLASAVNLQSWPP